MTGKEYVLIHPSHVFGDAASAGDYADPDLDYVSDRASARLAVAEWAAELV